MERKNTEELYKYLGKRIKKFRTDFGYSVEETAMRLGITPRTLTAYENGTRQMSAQLLIKMSKLYGITYEELTDTANIRRKLCMYRDLTRCGGEPVFDYECLVVDLEKY